MDGTGRVKKTRTALLGLLLMGVVFLSGCVRFRTEITIHRDGTADVSILYALEEDPEHPVDPEEVFSEIREDLEDDGWDCEDYEEDNYYGLVWSRKGVPGGSLGRIIRKGLKQTIFESGERLEWTELRGGLYELDWTVLGGSGNDIEEVPEGSDDDFLEVVVHFPRKPERHNATAVSDDGKTLTWDLFRMEDLRVHALFHLRLIEPAVAAGIAATVVILAAGCFFAVRKRRKTGQSSDL